MSEELKAALARIACLEGEIAKRDEELAACRVAVENCEMFRVRIAELDDLVLSLQCKVIERDAELSAIKAQEPVLPCELDLESSFSCAEKEASLHAGVRDTFYFALIECLQKNKLYRAPAQKELSVVMPERKKAHNCEGIEFWKANGWNDCLDELASIYAAPVSEAKAQGVVIPAELDRAFITGESCDGVYRVVIQSEKLKEMQSVHSWLARLNAAPVQQVSVPDGYAIVPIVPTPEMIKAALDKPCFDPLGDPLPWSHITRTSYAAMLAAAPAAPAADAGLVEALELAANRLDRLALEQGEFWRGYATAWADEARATANGVKS